MNEKYQGRQSECELLMRIAFVGLLMVACLWSGVAHAQEVAATVGEEIITVRAAERERKRLAAELPEDRTAAAVLQADALAACVQRALALQQLVATKQAASQADVDQAITRIKKQLTDRNVPLQDYLHKLGLDEAQWRSELLWGLSWDGFLKAQLTDENLQRFFQKRSREYDGTELRVAHILWKVSPSDDRAAIEKLRQVAAGLQGEITAGTITFAAAAAKHSQAPTAAAGGDIGFIQRHQPMPEAFSQAAFQLERGQVSAPIETAFGIHLITCLEIKPGAGTWQTAREELRRDMTRYLFDWLAERRAPQAKVTYTGDYPHRDPLSGSVVLPR